MGHFLRTAEIVKQLKLHMPVKVTYPDPFGTGPVVCDRENVLALLVVNANDIESEGSFLAALYAEMGRFAAAANYASELAEAEYRRWQATVSAEFRATRSHGDKKAPTVAEVEEHYRTLPEYVARKTASAQLKAQAQIFEDLREGFALKGRVVVEQARSQRGYEGVARSENTIDNTMQRLLHGSAQETP